MSGSPKPVYSPTNDPDVRSSGGRFIAPATSHYPPTQMLEKHFAVSPTESEHPRFNPLNKDRPRSSSLLNINDSVAMHLLVETAIIDSNEYEVLSFEEVEELKKEHKFLAGRIDAAKRKLALESKVRDAALSLSRLYNNKKGKRRSLLGGNEMTQKTDEELVQSNQKVEQLVQELWGLNNRAVEIQRRLLQHAAGILGMTHQGGVRTQGIPGGKGKAPNPRASMQGPSHMNGDEFDDRSFYRTSDNLDSIATNGVYTNRRIPNHRASMNVQPNGHVAQPLDPQVEYRLEQLNIELRRFLMATTGVTAIPDVPQPTGDNFGVHEQITMLEEGISFFQSHPPLAAAPLAVAPLAVAPLAVAPGQPLPGSEELEQTITTLWDMLVLGNEDSRTRRASVSGKGQIKVVDSDSEDGDAYGTAFSINAFSYKVQSLYTKATNLRADRTSLQKQLEQQKQMSAEEREAFQQTIQSKEEEYGMEVMKLEQEIDQLNEAIQSRDKDLTASNQELDTLTDEIKNIQEELRDREDERDQAREDLQAAQQEIAGLKHEVEERRKTDSVNRDQDAIAVEQELNARLSAESRLKEMEAAEVALLAKFKEKEAALKEKEEAEDNLLSKLREKEMELISRVEAENELRSILKEKESALALKDEADAEVEQKLHSLQEQLADAQEERNVTKTEYEAAKAELDTIVASTGARFKSLESDLEQLKQDKAAAEAENALTKEQSEALRLEIKQKGEKIQKMEVEMEELIDRVAQLSTEAVTAKAELDQAYGSKSQRAAETAAAAKAAAAREAAKSTAIDPAFLQQLDELEAQNLALINEIAVLKSTNSSVQNLEKRNQLLQAELNGMLQDFEGLTKQSIEFENERTKLEGIIDKLREKVEALETAVADERVRMLGSRSMSAGSNGEFPGPRSGGESMSTQVLKTEFKKMMRDMRSEQMKALRGEQEERRKLEATIRKMKQEQIQQRRSGPMSPIAAVSSTS